MNARCFCGMLLKGVNAYIGQSNKTHLFSTQFIGLTVRPRDTRPQAARTSQVHVFKLGPKIFEMQIFCTFLHVFLINEYLRCTFLMNEYLRCTFLHVFTCFCTFFARFLVHEYLRYTIHLLNSTNLPMHGFFKILHSIKQH